MLSCIDLLVQSVYQLTLVHPKCTFRFSNCSKMYNSSQQEKGSDSCDANFCSNGGSQIEIFLSFDETPKMLNNLALTFV